jgi:hypothetical protein
MEREIPFPQGNVLFPEFPPNNRIKTQEYDVTYHIMGYEPISQANTSRYYDMKGKYAERNGKYKADFSRQSKGKPPKKGFNTGKTGGNG